MSSSFKKNRPTAIGAVAEALLALAVGVAVIGVCRGWFDRSGSNRIRPTSKIGVGSTALDGCGWRRF